MKIPDIALRRVVVHGRKRLLPLQVHITAIEVHSPREGGAPHLVQAHAPTALQRWISVERARGIGKSPRLHQGDLAQLYEEMLIQCLVQAVAAKTGAHRPGRRKATRSINSNMA